MTLTLLTRSMCGAYSLAAATPRQLPRRRAMALHAIMSSTSTPAVASGLLCRRSRRALERVRCSAIVASAAKPLSAAHEDQLETIFGRVRKADDTVVDGFLASGTALLDGLELMRGGTPSMSAGSSVAAQPALEEYIIDPAKPPYYITTPIYYVNGLPHIGHAYTTLACDVLARFKRLDGHEVRFLTGTDEHGQKVEQSATAAGETPIVFADRVSDIFRDLLGTFGFSNDDFIRTTEPRHAEATQALWQRLLEAGDIYLGAYEGWYSIRDECFYGEDELIDDPKSEGTKCAPTGAPVEWVAESSYFFKLSAYTDKLIEHINSNPDFISPVGRKNEVIAFMREGLRDLSISRTTFGWGIPVCLHIPRVATPSHFPLPPRHVSP